jgi:NADH-quinone oxidoreductase subunit N
MNLTDVILPELILIIIACGLFLLGISSQVAARRAAAMLALIGVVVVIVVQGAVIGQQAGRTIQDFSGTIEVGPFANFVKLITGVVGVILVLLAWPTNRDATGSRSLQFGHDAGEFYALMLLAMAGLMLVADSNDLMLLFLGIELASIPTYIMVSISRPLPAAQEAGVKYFFLGAMAAAIMLFGFSYLYGTTGMTRLSEIRTLLNPPAGVAVGSELPHELTPWQMLAVCMLLAGFAFKIAAVPLHTYVGDVYQGAATPVTAFLAFVPKTSGFVAIVKVLSAVGGNDWSVPHEVVTLLVVLAALTMTVGNALGLLQQNVKRVLAYSSIAHSGYMLVGVAALVAAGDPSLDLANREEVQRAALSGVLFYLAAYGIMNSGAFGVLMLLPPREHAYDRGDGTRVMPEHLPATSAETYEDIAGVGRRHIGMALGMAVCCFSLIGMPLTVGFFGKLYLVQPALGVGTRQMNWLVVIMMINAAIGAAYYLRIIGTMFLRAETTTASASAAAVEAELKADRPWYATPIGTAVSLSVALTLLLGMFFPATNRLSDRTHEAAVLPPAASPGGNTMTPAGDRGARPALTAAAAAQSPQPPAVAPLAATDR